MKTYIKKSAVALLAIVMLASCNDLFDKSDIKNNPNSPLLNQIGIAEATTSALVGLAVLHEDTDNRIASMWGGQLAGTSRQHLTFQNYNVSSGSFSWASGSVGGGNYYNVGVNLRTIQKTALAPPQIGMAQVAEAFLFAKMAALYGDVPYSEAMDFANHPTPKYDTQASIYAALITLLDGAILKLGQSGTIEGDFLYGNNGTAASIALQKAKWIRAAKTLQARLYLHQKNYAAAATAAAAGLQAGEDMLIPHGTAQQVDMNLNYDFFVNARPGDTAFDPGLGSYLPKFMCTDINTGAVGTQGVAIRNAKTNETNIYNAFFGFEAVQEGDGTIDPNVNDGVFQANSLSPVITYYESQLILAEALARQTGPAVADAGAITALNNVRAGLANGDIFGANYALGTSMYTAYDATDFLLGGTCSPLAQNMTTQAALLKEIASQKFIILLMQYETFTELRRLAVATPVIKLGVPINIGTQYPARFIYPQNEINTNPNTPNPVPNQFVKLPLFQ